MAMVIQEPPQPAPVPPGSTEAFTLTKAVRRRTVDPKTGLEHATNDYVHITVDVVAVVPYDPALGPVVTAVAG